VTDRNQVVSRVCCRCESIRTKDNRAADGCARAATRCAVTDNDVFTISKVTVDVSTNYGGAGGPIIQHTICTDNDVVALRGNAKTSLITDRNVVTATGKTAECITADGSV
jgi:hypothetical protein